MVEQARGLELKWKLFGCRHWGEVGQLFAIVQNSIYIWAGSELAPTNLPLHLSLRTVFLLNYRTTKLAHSLLMY
jgi:hypothetical protein